MSPISIPETAYLSILNAANALDGCGCDREQFVAAVYAELQGKPLGDGTVGVAIRTVMATFPHPTPTPKPSRWDRDRPRFGSPSKRSAA